MGDPAAADGHQAAASEDRLEGLLLVQRVAGGDGRAVGELYDRYSASLLAQIVSMLGDRAEAEDVLQDVFVQVWRQAGRYDHRRASVLTWLSMVARTRAIDRYRGGRSRQKAHEQAARFESGDPERCARGHAAHLAGRSEAPPRRRDGPDPFGAARGPRPPLRLRTLPHPGGRSSATTPRYGQDARPARHAQAAPGFHRAGRQRGSSERFRGAARRYAVSPRSTRFRILPVGLFGICVTISTLRGAL